MNTDIQNLRTALPTLSEKDQSFAFSLLDQFGKRGDLSDEQWYWVRKLATPKKANEQVGNLQLLKQLFDRAEQHLKKPAVTLMIDGAVVRIKPARGNTKYPGHIYATDPEFGGAYYGRVTPTGEFVEGRDASKLPSLVSTLRRLAVEPAKVAAEHGRLTGNCCFCNIALTDERSTAVGYGPICAKHYGLPWGSEKSSAQLEALAAEQAA